MDETFDSFETSSESEIVVVDSSNSDIYGYYEEDEEVAVEDEDGSHDEVALDDHEYKDSYYFNPELSDSNRSKNDGDSAYMTALGPSNGGFTTLDEVDENDFDESLIEEAIDECDEEEGDSTPSVASNDIVSENDISYGNLSMSDADDSAGERSVKYDGDVDASSQQASTTSSYSDAINEDSRGHPFKSMLGPPRKIRTIEESSLGISSTSFRSSSFVSKALSNATSIVGESSIRSTVQRPSKSEIVLRAEPTTTGSVRTISESERSNRSESSTMVSRGTGTHSRQSLKKNRTGKTRRKKTQRIISDHSTSIGVSRENLEEHSHDTDPSTASRRTPGPDSRANKEAYRLQRRKHSKNKPTSPSSTASSHSVGEIFNGTDSRCASIAVLGTMSGTGKSVIAAALCRIFTNGGTKCAPFKSQNTGMSTCPALLPDLSCRDTLYDSFSAMVEKKIASVGTTNGRGSSLSIAPTKEQGYGQIGIAQSLQAEACKIVPLVQMNPIIFKSRGRNEKDESMCAMIVMGKQIIRETYEGISKIIPALQNIVLDSHLSLSAVTGANVIVIQGAGACSELNHMDGDIVNLPLVRCLQCPWLLVANDENGGVFAQVVGTKMCVSKRDWALCAGIIVNKVKSEINEFVLGLEMLKQMTGKPLYAMPFLDDLCSSDEEAIDIERRLSWEKKGSNQKDRQYVANKLNEVTREKPSVVVVSYPHSTISNDLYPLEKDSRFHLEWRRKRLPKPYPTTTTVILPGSRLPLLDLKWLQDSGWAEFVRKHVAAGGTVLGLCGGYQMLGWKVMEGTNSKQGIGLLPISSTAKPAEPKTDPSKGQLYPSGVHVEGIEVNCGFSEVVSSEHKNVANGRYKGLTPLIAYENGKPEGMRLGRVQGTYLHGILRSAKARVELLVPIPDRKQFHPVLAGDTTDDPLDKFASHLETCGLDYDTLRTIVFTETENAT